MALLKRLSNFWSYVSPHKNAQTQQQVAEPPVEPPQWTPSSVSVFADRSINLGERADNRHGQSRIDTTSIIQSAKRKRPHTPSPGPRRSKSRRTDDDRSTAESNYDTSQSSDRSSLDELDREGTELSSLPTGDSLRRKLALETSGSSEESDDNSEPDVDDSIIARTDAEYEYESNGHLRVIEPAIELEERGISAEQLRDDGWDDEHITLVHKLAMRGYEPLMPAQWKFVFRYMPETLFATDNDAIITSLRGRFLHGEKALEKMFGLGAWMRDRVLLKGRITPEKQAAKQLAEYISWASEDSGLDPKTILPLLTIVTGPADMPVKALQAKAQHKLAKIANQWREALRVRRSIENSPGSMSTQLSEDMPTLYAIVASHTLVALVAYRPEDTEPEIKSVSLFDMNDRACDVWNAFAFAIIVCHLRNVQLRLAEDTGIGVKIPCDAEEDSDDPDA